MEKQEISNNSTGLEKLLTKINMLIPQAPPSFCDDTHQINCVRRALLGVNWAQIAISQLSASNFTFNRFAVSISERLQLAEETGQVNTIYTHLQRYGRTPEKNR